MIENIIVFFGMLIVTLIIRYLLNRAQRFTDFWTGPLVIVAICVIGLISGETEYFAAILGYMAGDEISRRAGWNNKK